MSVKCLHCQDGLRLPTGWKCDVCGAASSFAAPPGSLRTLIAEWRREAEKCNRGAGKESTNAKVTARVAVGGTLSSCANALERVLAENERRSGAARDERKNLWVIQRQ